MFVSNKTIWLVAIVSLPFAVLIVTVIEIPIAAAIIMKKTGLLEIKFKDKGRTG
jgi:hypothetical protein